MAAVTPEAIAALEHLLLQVTKPDTAVVRAAENALRDSLRTRDSIVRLTVVASTSAQIAVRQLATMMLRVQVPLHYPRASRDVKATVKRGLLNIIENETARLVRINACYAVASVARAGAIESNSGGWPELAAGIVSASESQDPAVREIAYVLLYALTEAQSLPIADHGSICRLYARALQSETDARAQLAALRAASSLVTFIADEEEIMVFQSLVPVLLSALERAAFAEHQEHAALQEEVSLQVLESLSDLIMAPAPLLDPYVSECLTLLCRVVVATDVVSMELRSAASVALSDLLQEKSRVMLKKSKASAHQGVDAIGLLVQTCAHLAKETVLRDPGYAARAAQAAELDETGDEAPEQDYDSLRGLTEIVIESVAGGLPAKRIAEPLLSCAADLMKPNSPDRSVEDRAAGALIVLVASEGVRDMLVASPKAFNGILELTASNMLPSPFRTTAEAALTKYCLLSIAQFAENVSSTFGEMCAQIIPRVGQYLGEPHPEVRSAAQAAIQKMFEVMEEDELAPFVESVTNSALYALSLSDSASSGLACLDTLSTVAQSAGKRFQPLLETTMKTVLPLMQITDKKLVMVRCGATSLVGILLIVSQECYEDPSQGENPYLSYAGELLTQAFNFPNEEDIGGDGVLDLRQVAYGLCANVTIALMKSTLPNKQAVLDAFAPNMFEAVLKGYEAMAQDENFGVQQVQVIRDSSAVVPANILKFAQQDQDQNALDASNSNAARLNRADSDDSSEEIFEDDDDDDVHIPGRSVHTNVRLAAADCRVAALHALETLLEGVSPEVSQRYLSEALGQIVQTIDYPHPIVRASTLSALVTGALALRPRAMDPANRPIIESIARLTHSVGAMSAEVNWIPGVRVLQPETEFYVLLDQTVLPCVLEGIVHDTDKEVAAEACAMLGKMCDLLGFDALCGKEDALLQGLMSLLTGNAACQNANEVVNDEEEGPEDVDRPEENDDENEDEDRRHDETLTDNAVDALGSLAKAMGDKFLPAVDSTLKVLLRLAKKSMPERDRVCALGGICLVLQAVAVARLGDANAVLVSPATAARVLKSALRGAGESSNSMLPRNAVYLLGVLAETGVMPAQDFGHVLGAIQSVFATFAAPSSADASGWEAENRALVCDNACGAIARMLLRFDAMASLPKDMIVQGWMEKLPNKIDREEDWVVLDALAAHAKGTPKAREIAREIATAYETEMPPVVRGLIELICA